MGKQRPRQAGDDSALGVQEPGGEQPLAEGRLAGGVGSESNQGVGANQERRLCADAGDEAMGEEEIGRVRVRGCLP